MYDALAVQVGESFEHLEDVGRDERFGKLAILLDRLFERAAFGKSTVEDGERWETVSSSSRTHSRMMLR